MGVDTQHTRMQLVMLLVDPEALWEYCVGGVAKVVEWLHEHFGIT